MQEIPEPQQQETQIPDPDPVKLKSVAVLLSEHFKDNSYTSELIDKSIKKDGGDKLFELMKQVSPKFSQKYKDTQSFTDFLGYSIVPQKTLDDMFDTKNADEGKTSMQKIPETPNDVPNPNAKISNDKKTVVVDGTVVDMSNVVKDPNLQAMKDAGMNVDTPAFYDSSLVSAKNKNNQNFINSNTKENLTGDVGKDKDILIEQYRKANPKEFEYYDSKKNYNNGKLDEKDEARLFEKAVVFNKDLIEQKAIMLRNEIESGRVENPEQAVKALQQEEQNNINALANKLKAFPQLAKEMQEKKEKQLKFDEEYKKSNSIAQSAYNIHIGAQKAVNETFLSLMSVPKMVKSAFGTKDYDWTDALSDVSRKMSEELSPELRMLPSSALRDIVGNQAIIENNGKKYSVTVDDKGKATDVRDEQGFILKDESQAKIVANQYNNLKEEEKKKTTGTTINSSSLLSATGQTVTTMASLLTGAGALGAGLRGVGVGSKLAQGIGLTSSGAILEYNTGFNEAVESGMNPNNAKQFALWRAIAMGAAENISPGGLISNAIQKTSANQMAKYLAKGVSFDDASKAVIKNIGKEIGQENAQEFTQNMIDNLSKVVANNTLGSNMKTDVTDFNKNLETVILTTIVTAPMALLGAKPMSMRSDIQRDAIFEASKNPELYTQKLDDLVQSGEITPQRKDAVTALINKNNQILKALPKDLPEGKKSMILDLMSDRKFYEENLENPNVLPTFKKKYEEKVNQIDESVEQIIEAKPDAQGNINVEMPYKPNAEVQKQVEEEVKNEPLPVLEENNVVNTSTDANPNIETEIPAEQPLPQNNTIEDATNITGVPSETSNIETETPRVETNSETTITNVPKQTKQPKPQQPVKVESFDNEDGTNEYRVGKNTFEVKQNDDGAFDVFKKGEKETLPPTNPFINKIKEAHYLKLAEKANDEQREMAVKYLESPERLDDVTDRKKMAIANNMKRIMNSELERYFGVGKVPKGTILNYTTNKKNNAFGIDQIAMYASNEMSNDPDASVEFDKITPQDVIDFIKEYPSGTKMFIAEAKNNSPRTQIALEHKRKYGFEINKSIANKMLGQSGTDKRPIEEILRENNIPQSEIPEMKKRIEKSFKEVNDIFGIDDDPDIYSKRLKFEIDMEIFHFEEKKEAQDKKEKLEVVLEEDIDKLSDAEIDELIIEFPELLDYYLPFFDGKVLNYQKLYSFLKENTFENHFPPVFNTKEEYARATEKVRQQLITRGEINERETSRTDKRVGTSGETQTNEANPKNDEGTQKTVKTPQQKGNNPTKKTKPQQQSLQVEAKKVLPVEERVEIIPKDNTKLAKLEAELESVSQTLEKYAMFESGMRLEVKMALEKEYARLKEDVKNERALQPEKQKQAEEAKKAQTEIGAEVEKKEESKGDKLKKYFEDLKSKTEEDLFKMSLKMDFDEFIKVNYDYFFSYNFTYDHTPSNYGEPLIASLFNFRLIEYYSARGFDEYFDIGFADYKSYENNNKGWFYLSEEEAGKIINEFNKKFNTNIEFSDGEYLIGISKFDTNSQTAKKNALNEIVRFTHYINTAYGLKMGYEIPTSILNEYKDLYLIKSQKDLLNQIQEKISTNSEIKTQLEEKSTEKPKESQMNDSWRKEFERAKKENDLKAIDTLYNKVKIALNGLAQGKGEETVKDFENLKKEIEQYAQTKKEQEKTTEKPKEKPKKSTQKFTLFGEEVSLTPNAETLNLGSEVSFVTLDGDVEKGKVFINRGNNKFDVRVGRNTYTITPNEKGYYAAPGFVEQTNEDIDADELNLGINRKRQPKITNKNLGNFQQLDPAEAPKQAFKIFNALVEFINKFNPKGRLAQKTRNANVLGTYYVRTKNIDVKSLNDFATAIHEVTHAIDIQNKIVENLTNAEKEALADYFEIAYPGADMMKSSPLNLKATEGLAMLAQNYVTFPTDMLNNPTTFALIDRHIFNGNEKFKEMITEAFRISREYNALPLVEKISGRVANSNKVSQPNEKGFTQTKVQKTEQYLLDAIAPLERQMKTEGKANTVEDASLVLRTLAHGTVANVVHQNTAGNEWNIKRVWEGIKLVFTKKNNVSPPSQNQYWALDKDGNPYLKHDFNFNTIASEIRNVRNNDEFIRFTQGRVKTNEDAENYFGSWLIARRVYNDHLELDALNNELDTFARLLEGKIAQNPNYDTENDLKKIDELKDRIDEQVQLIENDGFERQDIEKVYNDFFKYYAPIAQKLDALIKTDLEFLRDTGIIDKEKFAILTDKQGYVPFKRVVEYNEINNESTSSAPSMVSPTGRIGALQKRKGSDKPIINPLLGAILNHAEILRKGQIAIFQNKMAQFAYDTVKNENSLLNGLYEVVEKPTDKLWDESKKSDTLMQGKLNGQKVVIRMPKEIKGIVDNALDYQSMDFVQKFATGLDKIFKIGTTGIYVPFTLVNFLLLDTPSAWINSKYNYIPVISPLYNVLLRGNMKGTQESNYMKEYLTLAKSSQTSFNMNDEGYKNVFDALKKNDKDNIPAYKKYFLKPVGEMFDALIGTMGAFGNGVEILSRANEYILARKDGKDVKTSLELAGRVSGSFHHKGDFNKGVVTSSIFKYVPYLSAASQAGRQTFKFRDEKGNLDSYKLSKFAFALTAYTTAIITPLMYALSFEDDEERKRVIEAYKSIPPNLFGKGLYIPDYTSGGYGMYQVRVPEQLAWLGGVINMAILNNLEGGTPYKVKDFVSVGTSFVPDNFKIYAPIISLFEEGADGAAKETQDLLLKWIPVAPLKSSILVTMNKKDFPDVRDIDTKKDLALPAQYRYDKYTSPLAKWMGATFNQSPKRIDAFLEGTFGRSIKYATAKENYLSKEMFNKTFYREMYLGSARPLKEFFEIQTHIKQQLETYNKAENKTKALKEMKLKPEHISKMETGLKICKEVKELMEKVEKSEKNKKEQANYIHQTFQKINALRKKVKD